MALKKSGRKQLVKLNRQVEKIFKAKKERRKALAHLPIEKKFRILLQLQKIASPILKSRGLGKAPWRL